MTETPRPIKHLADLMQRFPGLPHAVDNYRSLKGKSLPSWPDWCFLPMAAWQAIASLEPAEDRAAASFALGAIGTWRYTQGIYCFDPDLLDALTESDFAGILPARVLLRLPQWSVYIDLPPNRYLFDALPVFGFWAWLEYDARDGDNNQQELRLLFDTSDGLHVVILYLGHWTLYDAFAKVVDAARLRGAIYGVELPPITNDMISTVVAELSPYISLLLYLCSQEPEVVDERVPGAGPHNPTTKRVKTGARLFPPSRYTTWQVGSKIGETLRSARLGALGESGRTVRPHIRRGHWHGYWTGPRSQPDARGFVYYWQPPTLIHGSAPAISVIPA